MALHPGQRKRHFPEEVPVEWGPIRRDLEENEVWYRDLVEHSQVLLCVHDQQEHGGIAGCNFPYLLHDRLQRLTLPDPPLEPAQRK